jgi:hypothetical protein
MAAIEQCWHRSDGRRQREKHLVNCQQLFVKGYVYKYLVAGSYSWTFDILVSTLS